MVRTFLQTLRQFTQMESRDRHRRVPLVKGKMQQLRFTAF